MRSISGGSAVSQANIPSSAPTLTRSRKNGRQSCTRAAVIHLTPRQRLAIRLRPPPSPPTPTGLPKGDDGRRPVRTAVTFTARGRVAPASGAEKRPRERMPLTHAAGESGWVQPGQGRRSALPFTPDMLHIP